MNQPLLSVIIPSYNEKSNIDRGVLDEVATYLAKQPYQWEVLLSDDGSIDGTTQALEAYAKQHPGFRVVANIHAGKAPTVTAGMLAAKGAWRLFTDFDQSTPIQELEKLWPFAQQGIEVVIGSREMVGARRDKEPFLRHLMGRVFNIIVQLLAVDGILDTQCGFKLFSKKATESLFSKLTVYGAQNKRNDAFTGAFDVELLFLAKRLGFSIREVPILWKHAETVRVSPLKDSLRMLRDIILIRIAELQGKYDFSQTQSNKASRP
jgi:glycosyltransferase involved in cell wall biosynthesis